MRELWFLKLDGIAGESADAGHRGEIEVQTWSWAVTGGAMGSIGAGAGSGKAVFADFQFGTRVSAASPPLFLACATGRHVRTATFTGVRQNGDRSSDFLTYVFTDVTISSVQVGDTPGGTPLESFSLRFAKVEMSYRPQRADGSAGPAVTATFDLLRKA